MIGAAHIPHSDRVLTRRPKPACPEYPVQNISPWTSPHRQSPMILPNCQVDHCDAEGAVHCGRASADNELCANDRGSGDRHRPPLPHRLAARLRALHIPSDIKRGGAPSLFPPQPRPRSHRQRCSRRASATARHCPGRPCAADPRPAAPHGAGERARPPGRS